MSMTNEEMLAAHAEADLEFKRLQIADLTERNQSAADAKEARRMKLRKQEADVKENERQRLIREANCTHKKGGRNRSGLDRGNDTSNYAVITNTYPAGDVQAMCQRCGKIWVNPPITLKRSDPEKYDRDLREYRRALEFPTDNTPSGTQLFLITKDDPEDDMPRRGKDAVKAAAKTAAPRKAKKTPKAA